MDRRLNGTAIEQFETFLAPLGASEFFAEYYEKKHLHLRAESTTRADLLSDEELIRAIFEVPSAVENIVCFPEQVGTTREALLSDVSRLREYLEAGHPLVWNRARGISARIDLLTGLLADTFGGHVWPNVYATGEAGTPFDMHFDAHEVFAVHCAGEKTWELSAVRVDRPLEAVEMEPAIRHALRARCEEASSRLLDSFSVRPGDLVYIPRGQFHNARTLKGRSLHVTFGIELPTGFDLAKRLVMEILADPAMREYPLPEVLDPDGTRGRLWCNAVAERLRQTLSSLALAEARNELQRRWMKKSGGGAE